MKVSATGDNKIAYLYDGKSHQDAKQEFVAVKDILEPWNPRMGGTGIYCGKKRRQQCNVDYPLDYAGVFNRIF